MRYSDDIIEEVRQKEDSIRKKTRGRVGDEKSE